MEKDWVEYQCKSGQALFQYNKVTGEHNWPQGIAPEILNQIFGKQMSKPALLPKPAYKLLCSIATQTDDNGCNNGCMSMYVKTRSSIAYAPVVPVPQAQLGATEANSLKCTTPSSLHNISVINAHSSCATDMLPRLQPNVPVLPSCVSSTQPATLPELRPKVTAHSSCVPSTQAAITLPQLQPRVSAAYSLNGAVPSGPHNVLVKEEPRERMAMCANTHSNCATNSQSAVLPRLLPRVSEGNSLNSTTPSGLHNVRIINTYPSCATNMPTAILPRLQPRVSEAKSLHSNTPSGQHNMHIVNTNSSSGTSTPTAILPQLQPRLSERNSLNVVQSDPHNIHIIHTPSNCVTNTSSAKTPQLQSRASEENNLNCTAPLNRHSSCTTNTQTAILPQLQPRASEGNSLNSTALSGLHSVCIKQEPCDKQQEEQDFRFATVEEKIVLTENVSNDNIMNDNNIANSNVSDNNVGNSNDAYGGSNISNDDNTNSNLIGNNDINNNDNMSIDNDHNQSTFEDADHQVHDKSESGSNTINGNGHCNVVGNQITMEDQSDDNCHDVNYALNNHAVNVNKLSCDSNNSSSAINYAIDDHDVNVNISSHHLSDSGSTSNVSCSAVNVNTLSCDSNSNGSAVNHVINNHTLNVLNHRLNVDMDNKNASGSGENLHSSSNIDLTKFVMYSETLRVKKTYECAHCKKTFNRKYALKRHDLIHKNLKPYKCHICQKTYRTIGNLNEHIKSHSKEKPFECSVCKKRFTSRSNKKKHEFLHIEGNCDSECSVCKKIFNKKAQLLAHADSCPGITQ